MPSTISNPNSVSLLPLSSRGRGSSTLGHRFLALHGVRQSPLGAPRNLAVKAMVADGRDSLDHLQRAGKMRQQQEPQRRAPKRGVAPSAPLGKIPLMFMLIFQHLFHAFLLCLLCLGEKVAIILEEKLDMPC